VILRRLVNAFRKQDWFTVMIETLIVVFGVFMGIQVSNWNQQREDRAAYELALDRYRLEIKANLEIIDTLDAESIDAFSKVTQGFEALLSCEDKPQNLVLVNAGVNQMIGTFGLVLRDAGLIDLTENEALLGQQSPSERKLFADIRHLMNVFLNETSGSENIPLQERMQNNPIIEVGSLDKVQTNYVGLDFSRNKRALKLKVPLNVACTDNTFIKSYYTWERWQQVLPVVTKVLREALQATQVKLKK
jgi:hypothetical protein